MCSRVWFVPGRRLAGWLLRLWGSAGYGQTGSRGPEGQTAQQPRQLDSLAAAMHIAPAQPPPYPHPHPPRALCAPRTQGLNTKFPPGADGLSGAPADHGSRGGAAGGDPRAELLAAVQRQHAEEQAAAGAQQGSESEGEACAAPLPEDHVEIEKSNVLILVRGLGLELHARYMCGGRAHSVQ